MDVMNKVQHESNLTTKIRELSPHMLNIVIMGVVIAKQDTRSFQSKKKPGQERCVLCFTIRDSPTDTINISCWGEESAVRNFDDKFQIMDIVEIRNPQVQLKHSSGSDNKYMPDVSSPFHLNISATYSELVLVYDASDEFSKLIHLPTKSATNHLTLADVIYNGQDIDGEHVNLLVALRSMEDYCNLIRAEVEPDELCDVKVGYNQHLRAMTGTVDGLTIITPNPEIQEAYSLYHYAQTVDFGINDNDSTSKFEDASSAAQVFTVGEVRNLLTMGCDISLSGDVQGVTYAVMSKLDLDGSSKLFASRCTKCRQRLPLEDEKCKNPNCAMGKGAEEMLSEQIFYFNIWLSDHTGTLKRCYLSGDGAEKFLNCTAEEFTYLSEDEKTNLKWQFLLERCKVCFKIVASSSGNPLLYITSCTLADIEEFVRSVS